MGVITDLKLNSIKLIIKFLNVVEICIVTRVW